MQKMPYRSKNFGAAMPKQCNVHFSVLFGDLDLAPGATGHNTILRTVD